MAERDATQGRHPTTRGWQFPPRDRAPLPGGARRVNLRELAARPGRFEHHLMVVAEVGGAQLEIATASEPLYFAHANISDEYALALSTGDAPVDGFAVRTFLSDTETGQDVARLRHRVGQLVLHPYGWLHWTGRLRPPFAPYPFAPGTRRCGLTLVFCASSPSPPAADRPLAVTPGLEAEAKAYVPNSAPLGLWDLGREGVGTVAQAAEAKVDLWVGHEPVAAPDGGYVVVLDVAESSALAATDLVYLPPGGGDWSFAGLVRALVVTSPGSAVKPPPPSWERVPESPFAPYEETEAGELPLAIDGLEIEAIDETSVRVRIGDGASVVPRYWLARMLFRVALHGYRVGYLETYGGFCYDDRAGHRLGLRDGGSVRFDEAGCAAAVERLYRAVAPEGYTERLV